MAIRPLSRIKREFKEVNSDEVSRVSQSVGILSLCLVRSFDFSSCQQTLSCQIKLELVDDTFTHFRGEIAGNIPHVIVASLHFT